MTRAEAMKQAEVFRLMGLEAEAEDTGGGFWVVTVGSMVYDGEAVWLYADREAYDNCDDPLHITWL